MRFYFDVYGWVKCGFTEQEWAIQPHLSPIEDSCRVNLRFDQPEPVLVLQQIRIMLEELLVHERVLFVKDPDRLLDEFFIHPDRQHKLFQNTMNFGNPVEPAYLASGIDYHTPTDGWLLVRYVYTEDSYLRVKYYPVIPGDIDFTNCIRNYLIDRFLAPDVI